MARRGNGRAERRSPACHGAKRPAPPQNTAMRTTPSGAEADAAAELGPNNERLHELQPRVVAALRDLMLGFGAEDLSRGGTRFGASSQARLFWQGLQYAWWNPQRHELASAVRCADDG